MLVCVQPRKGIDEIEFWLHQDDRLHDRVLYRRVDGTWSREVLSP